MQWHPKHLVPIVLGVLLGLFLPFEKPVIPQKAKKRGTPAVPRPQVGGPWSRQKVLDDHLATAVEVVISATGAEYVDTPTARVSTPDEVAGVLREDYDAAFRRMGAADDAQVAAMSRAFAGHVLAVYDPVQRIVHVLPENAVRAAEAVGDEGLVNEDVLRLLLVRMAVIAQDRQIYPEWKAALDAADNNDALNAAGAVLQGHAQYETERVAEHWGLKLQFDGLVTLLTAPPADGAAPSTMQSEVRFAILDGHKFMKAIARKKRHADVLRDPPKTRNPIFDPDGYLGKPKPAPKGKVPERVAEEFKSLLSGEGWSMTPDPLDREAVDALLDPLPASYRTAVMAAFESGTAWTSKREEDGATVTVRLIEMKHEGTAEGYVNLAQGAAKERGETIEEGAGRDSGLPGYASTRKDPAGSSQWTFAGKYVLGLTSTCPDVTREAQDDALEAAAEILSKQSRRRRRK